MKAITMLVLVILFIPLMETTSVGTGELMKGKVVYTPPLSDNQFYGGMWNKTTGGFQTIDLITTEVYSQITDLYPEGKTKGFTIANGNMTTLVGGYYQASFAGSINKGSISEYGIKLFVNSIGEENCYSHFDVIATMGGTPSFSCFVNLTTGDIVNIKIDDHVNPVNDPVIENFNLNLVRIGR